MQHWSKNGPLDSRELKAGLPDNRVACIALDSEGVWVGTAAGLVRGTGTAPWDSLKHHGVDQPISAIPPSTGAIVTASAPISIGVFARAIRSIALPDSEKAAVGESGRINLWAVQYAAGEANVRTLGFQKRPELVINAPGFDRYGWGLPEDDVAFLAIQRNCTGLVGSIGPDDQLGTAVIARTGIPFVNSAVTPLSIDERANPWIVRCRAHDPAQDQAQLDYLFDTLHKHRLAVLRTSEPCSEIHLNRMLAYARSRGHPIVLDRIRSSDAKDVAMCIQELRRANAEAVLTWSDARTSANILSDIRNAGLHAVFVGSDEIVCDEFIAQAGDAAAPALAPQPCGHRRQHVAREKFVECFAQTWPKELARSDPLASFDAVCHLLEAVELAGADRLWLMDTLRRMSEPAVAILRDHDWISTKLPEVTPRRR